jgi:hypothetical protein
MKEQLIKFIEDETGFRRHPITEAIEKYFNGLEVEWQEKEREMYIHETESLICTNDELYIEGEFGQLIWNCDTLFNDLPDIVHMVYKARKEKENRIKEQIEEITRLITI